MVCDWVQVLVCRMQGFITGVDLHFRVVRCDKMPRGPVVGWYTTVGTKLFIHMNGVQPQTCMYRGTDLIMFSGEYPGIGLFGMGIGDSFSDVCSLFWKGMSSQSGR